ncbi:unnamed protein product [Rotaria magnacalcarata]|uniref:Uncharacterized protein n=3 Tax=Rotaria magnacalcarata TaxID=392030 RepID=A0A815AHJ2_9BILA|nr:unnamed protein product [Rotaria magnacalcarata]CAF3940850.1 unnamed protein product [Rotaria magnacalcarata]CAF3993575.1 unnamed protein product [Rotaria magnacalcarata]
MSIFTTSVAATLAVERHQQKLATRDNPSSFGQNLVGILDGKHETFGRCVDEIFVTWNQSDDKLYNLINTINQQYPDMQMVITITKMSNSRGQSRQRQEYFKEHWEPDDRNLSIRGTSSQPELHYQQVTRRKRR